MSATTTSPGDSDEDTDGPDKVSRNVSGSPTDAADDSSAVSPDSPTDIPDSADEASADGASEFRAPVVRGLLWQFVGRGTWQVSQMVVVVLLARLLTPHQYGIAGMVLVVISFEPLLAGTGLASALVQRPTITEVDKSTVFWTNAAIGLVACLIGVAVSPLVAHFYGEAQVEPLLAAVSVVFLLSSLSSVQANLLIRDMNFRSMELRSMVATVTSAVSAIVIAAEGGGAWALIAQQLVYYSVSFVMLTKFAGWRPRLTYSLESQRELRAFGGHMSGQILMTQLTQNSDNVLIGRFLGASALGLYTFGYSLIMLPVTRIASPLVQVLYPVFSRVQHDRQRLISIWLRSLRLMVAITLPAMLGLIVVAPDMVDVVFGARWHDATPVIQILAAVGLTFGVQNLNGIALQALGRTRLLFRCSCALFVAGLISFVVGLQWGIVGVAGCFAAVNVFFQPVNVYLTAHAMGASLSQCGRALSGVAQATVVLIVTSLLTRKLLQDGGVAVTPRLASTIAAGAVVYGAMLMWRAPEVLSEVRQFRQRRATPAPASAAA